MASTMDYIIHYAIRKGAYDHDLIGGGLSSKKYFFFRQEFDIGDDIWRNIKLDKKSQATFRNKYNIRHAIPNNGTIYDYTIGKHYDTLLDWAVANGRSLEDIMYGVNRPHYFFPDKHHVSLDALLRILDPKWAWNDNKQDTTDRDKIIKGIDDALTVAKTHIEHAFYLLNKLN